MADDQDSTQDDSSQTDNSFDPNSAFSQMIAALQKSHPQPQQPRVPQQQAPVAPPPQVQQPRIQPPQPQQQQAPQQWSNQQLQQTPSPQQSPQDAQPKDYSVGINDEKPQNIWQKVYASMIKNNPKANSQQILSAMKAFHDSGAFETVAKGSIEQQVYDAAIKSGKSPFDAAQDAVKATTKMASNAVGTGKTVEEQLYAALIKQGMSSEDAAKQVQKLRGISAESVGDKETAKQEADTKSIANKKSEEEIGKARGNAEVDYAKAQAGAPQLQKTIDSLLTLADTATYTVGGQAYNSALRQLGQPITPGGIDAAKYQSLVNNVLLPSLRATFGARVTNYDIQAAKSMLGDPNLSPAEKKAQLNSFIDQKLSQIKTEGETVKNLGGTSSPDMKEDSSSGTSAPATKTVNWSDL